MPGRTKRKFLFFVFSILWIILSCSFIPGSLPIPFQLESTTPTPTSALTQTAIISFIVEIPDISQSQNSLFLDILDEVTGLNIQPSRFAMLKFDDLHYRVEIPLPIGSVVKYRYSLQGSPAVIEHTSGGEETRYRLLLVQAPCEVKDIVTQWDALNSNLGERGTLKGAIFDENDQPVGGLLLSAGGQIVFSASDGSFSFEKLPAGNHQLVAYGIDGEIQPFQQGAIVAENSITQAIIHVVHSPKIKITFNVSVPIGTVNGAPIRIIGNLYSLGNVFADLRGGINTVAGRAPILALQSDGSYSISLELPVGTYLEYKYTLGDGFWNGELTTPGEFRVRKLIVPPSDTTINDIVEAWSVQDVYPVVFKVKTPEETSATDIINIQFNPGSWTEPIPMWSTGDNEWIYVLYNPHHILGDIYYRFCRNEQCERTSNITAIEADSPTMDSSFTVQSSIQTITCDITSWTSYPIIQQIQIPELATSSHPNSFITGVEFTSGYSPSWQPYLGQALQKVKEMNGDWAIITPGWHYIQSNPPLLSAIAGKDALSQDLDQLSLWANQKGQKIAVFPQSNHPDIDSWWIAAPRDEKWWQDWFATYTSFIINYADYAQRSGSVALILGEPGIRPALPNGYLGNGLPSGSPAYADTQWEQILLQIRQHYQGQIIWALSPEDIEVPPPNFLQAVDQVYYLYGGVLEGNGLSDAETLTTNIGRFFDEKIYPFQKIINKPLIIGIQYPSVSGAAKGCYSLPDSCEPFSSLENNYISITKTLPVDFQVQQDIYLSFISVIDQRNWINGLVTRGYYSPVGLRDISTSIRDKPAEAILQYWFQQ